MARTNVHLDDGLIRKARRLTGLKTKRAIVDRALRLLVRSETRKNILSYYGSGIWKGDLRACEENACGADHVRLAARFSRRAVAGALEHAKIYAPWSDGLPVLVGHDSGDLVQVR